MAAGAATLWRVRAGGNELNGGGYDSSISGAGTDYTDQDASQLSLTDFATSGAASTTLTSATGGFTSAMVGNCVRIASGTNFQTGYYFITAYTDTNTVTVDRTPTSGGAGNGGTGRIGGAFASIKSLASGGSSSPTLTTPLVAGNIIYVRGAGTDDPTSTDYTEDYFTFPSGSTAAGKIRLIGYNGRPNFSCSTGAIFYQVSGWNFSNLKFKGSGTTYADVGIISAGGTMRPHVSNCIFDANGVDFVGLAISSSGCFFKNTGGTTAGTRTRPAIYLGTFGMSAVGNYIRHWRGAGIYSNGNMNIATGNIVAECKADGIYFSGVDTTYVQTIVGNTVYKCTGYNIAVHNATAAATTLVHGNVSTEATTYNIACVADSATINDRHTSPWGYNFVYGAGTANYLNLTAPSTDVALTGDPFTNAAAGDFSLDNTASQGAAVRAAAATFLGALTVNYRDGGAVQHQDSGGGGGSVIIVEED